MSMKALEIAILRATRTIFNNAKLRQKDILEWSCGEIDARDGEVVEWVRYPGVFVSVATEHDKR